MEVELPEIESFRKSYACNTIRRQEWNLAVAKVNGLLIYLGCTRFRYSYRGFSV